jgi:hypothetical protein
MFGSECHNLSHVACCRRKVDSHRWRPIGICRTLMEERRCKFIEYRLPFWVFIIRLIGFLNCHRELPGQEIVLSWLANSVLGEAWGPMGALSALCLLSWFCIVWLWACKSLVLLGRCWAWALDLHSASPIWRKQMLSLRLYGRYFDLPLGIGMTLRLYRFGYVYDLRSSSGLLR